MRNRPRFKVAELALFGAPVAVLLFGWAVYRVRSGPQVRAATPVVPVRVSKPLYSPSSPVQDLSFSADGQTVMTGRSHGPVECWNTTTGKRVATFKFKGQDVYNAEFSPDGTVVGAWTDRELCFWSWPARKLLHVIPGGFSSSAFSPDGRLVATTNNSNTVRIWNLDTGQARLITCGISRVSMADFSPDGKALLVQGQFLWKPQRARSAKLPVYLDPNIDVVQSWDLKMGQLRWAVKGHGEDDPDWSSFSPDGRTFAIAWDKVQFLDTQTGKLKTMARDTDVVFCSDFEFSPRGEVALWSSFQRGLTLCDAATGEMRKENFGVNSSIVSIAFSKDGSVLALGDQSGHIRIWNVRNFDWQKAAQDPDLADPPLLLNLNVVSGKVE